MKSVAIIGAGPAGLSAAYELLKSKNDFAVTIFEKDFSVGGLAKTFEFDGGRIDVGGHLFFTNNKAVQKLWDKTLPISDGKMLVRERSSHILYKNNMISYPIELNYNTLSSLGIIESFKVIGSYFLTFRNNKKPCTLEQFYIKRFGRELYTLFFKKYTYKLWGISVSELSAEWGIQRIQKISLLKILENITNINSNSKENRSLIKCFNYPAYGSGQMWNALADKVAMLGGNIRLNCKVNRIILKNNIITSISFVEDNMEYTQNFDYVISSMPIRDMLINCNSCPSSIKTIANTLLYRDMIIVAVEINKEFMGEVLILAKDDNWIYVQDENYPFGRIQILNNWSPYSVNNADNILLELEFFCNENDEFWNKTDYELITLSIEKLKMGGFFKENSFVSSYFVKRIEKAYPIYAAGYNKIEAIKDWINQIENLRCIGRNGMHKYNNMDHSVESGIEAAKSLFEKTYDKERIWNVNTEQEYIER